jgi:hypothetical protein
MQGQNRTWLCSVAFLDIVGYTKRSVAKQIEVKQDLNTLIGNAVRQVPEQDRILVDTGDGAAVCFLADPVEALFFALGLRDNLLSEQHEGPEYECRIGINLGPVKVINDVTGRRNTLGDGINIAQRVMDFAAPNQILVSRSFYEVVSCLSDEYSALFAYRGVRRDKHVKSYDVYEAGGSGAGASQSGEAETAGGSDTGLETAGAALATTPCGDCGDSGDHDGVHWQPELLAALQRDLAAYIGPLAKILIRRAACKTRDIAELRGFLARSIGDAKERESFLARTEGLGSDPEPAGEARSAGEEASSDPAASRAAKSEGTAPAGKGVVMSAKHLTRMETLLTGYLGPVAKVVTRRALKKAASRDELLRDLGGHLKPEEREAFVKAMGGDESGG